MSVFKYLIYNPSSLKHFIFVLFLQLPFLVADAEYLPITVLSTSPPCKEIDMSYEVVKDIATGLNNAIRIELKDVESSDLIISLIGPQKMFLKDIKENEIKNLSKGTYSLVVVGRQELSGYCPKHVQVVIK